ncbi:MAG: NAD(P)-dependent oxidoreductase [Bacteroidaceae bacterium]
MKYIVTGACGFVGSALVKELLSHNKTEKVLCIDKIKNESRIPNDPRIEFLSLSIDSIDSLTDLIHGETYDVFYHYAWVGSAGPLRMDEKVQTQNALWNVNCLREAKKVGCKKFVAAGSIMEFEVHAVMYAQGTKPGMAYIYGVGKVLAHELCKPIANELGIDLVWAYITNAYGVGESSPRFINTTMRKIIHGERLEFTAGTQNYDFLYIDDVARAFRLLGEKGKANRGYIIGSGNARPLKKFILEMTNSNCPDNPPHFGDVPFTGTNLPLETFSTKPIEEDCGFKSEISFAEGTRRTMEWLKETENNNAKMVF